MVVNFFGALVVQWFVMVVVLVIVGMLAPPPHPPSPTSPLIHLGKINNFSLGLFEIHFC